MKKELDLSDIVIIGIIATTILAVLKTLGFIPYWWIVPIPVFGSFIAIVIYIII